MPDREIHHETHIHKCRHGHRGGGALYGMGVLGAAVYYVKLSTTFWMGALGLLKAFFWPAMIVYKVFQNLQL